MSASGSDIIVGYAEPPSPGDDCGCCEGLSVETPSRTFNRAGLSAIAYRVGTHSRFKESMLARLSDACYPALADLRSRDDDDFSIALLDSWAAVCDVLTFYQERIANESYLRSATEHLSVLELARLLGYRPLPGVAATTYLAFRLLEAPGAPEQALQQTRIPEGTRVNSIPGPGETQQTFETVEEIEARVQWNAIKPRMTQPQQLKTNSTSAYLKGTNTRLSKGDAILFVGKEREDGDVGSNQWDLRFVTKIESDASAGHTYIEWTANSGAGPLRSVKKPAGQNPKVYALRLRASLFGHNAIDPKLLHPKIWRQYDQNRFELKSVPGAKSAFVLDANEASNGWKPNEQPEEWKFLIEGGTFCLDNDYPNISKGSWIVLFRAAAKRLFRVQEINSQTISDYALSAKVSCASVDDPNNVLAEFDKRKYRKTSAFAASEELTLTDAPLTKPVSTDKMTTDRVLEDLEHQRLVFVRGKRARVRVVKPPFRFPSIPLLSAPNLSIGDVLTVLKRTEKATPFGFVRTWRLRDQNNVEREVKEGNSPFEFIANEDDNELIVKAAHVKSLVREGNHSTLTFESPLNAVFDRGSVDILANVAPATHGETVSDILGNGDASAAFQSFLLRQKPLTYVSAPTPSGAQSTLEVRVNDVHWEEVPTLLGRGPLERVYTTHIDTEGNLVAQFGDGLTGTRLPSGQNNVHARYRKGIGQTGNVSAGKLSLLMDRPLGVQDVLNPVAASGGDDPESIDQARHNAPLGVLTLDRLVSLSDYEDFARAFAGVAKALATWSWDGDTRRVFITVAGPDGNAIAKESSTFGNLVAALKASGDPFVRFTVASFQLVLFQLKLSVTAHPDYLADVVRREVEAALGSAFGFTARSLGQPVHLSEVMEVVHSVAGVIAMEVPALYRTTPPSNVSIAHPRLPAARPTLGSTGKLEAAELLLLDTASLVEGLEVHQ